jgi:opacity protein-like surface antigen
MGGAFGDLHYEGAQFGYNFQNAPVTVFGSVGSLKYDSGLGTALSSSFNNPNSSTVAGYNSHVGVEFRPTSNLSLSFGAGFSQQGSGLTDSDIHSDLPPGASPLAFGHR